MKKRTIIEVSQFFDLKGYTPKNILTVKDVPVCLSVDKKSCLWTETPIIKEVKENEVPSIGKVWLINQKGKLTIWKSNIDSSD